MTSIIFDISNFSKVLYDESLNLFCCFQIFYFDKSKNRLLETSEADKVRVELVKEKRIKPMWLSFSVGYELLFKSVLTKYNALNISTKKVSSRTDKIPKAKKLEKVERVYSFIKSAEVKSDSNYYLKKNLKNNNITHIYDFSTGTLGNSLGRLKTLENILVITTQERNVLEQSSQLLIDLRRNVDAHTFYGLTVTKDINGDLSDVYLPAINLLINIYHRK